MDEMLQRQLLRQLKFLNFWIKSLAVFMLVGFLVLGFLIYKVITFTHNIEDKFTALQQKTSQTLDVQKKLCDTKSVGAVLQNRTNACK